MHEGHTMYNLRSPVIPPTYSFAIRSGLATPKLSFSCFVFVVIMKLKTTKQQRVLLQTNKQTHRQFIRRVPHSHRSHLLLRRILRGDIRQQLLDDITRFQVETLEVFECCKVMYGEIQAASDA